MMRTHCLVAAALAALLGLAPGVLASTPGAKVLLAQTQPATQPPVAVPAPVTPPATTTPPAPATPPAATPPAASPPAAPAAPGTTPPATPAPAAPGAAAPDAPDGLTLPSATPPAQPGDDANAPSGDNEDFSVGDLPEIETVELTPETARKALDAYVLVREKYKDADLENYESIQDFVDKTDQGKALEKDVKAAGFASVTDWDTAVATLGFAYSNAINDQTADIKGQIEELKADTEMAQDMRDRMITALNAMIPSDNNRKIVEDLIKDPAYADKIKLLETEDE